MTKTNPLLSLPAHPENPREISPQELEGLKASRLEYGDLGGIVFNVRTKRTVGGHQRVRTFDPNTMAPVIQERFPKPTRTGTVAIGYIDADGERFSYREVSWDPKREKAAMVAANKHGGHWDNEKLRDIVEELKEAHVSMDLIGFATEEVNKLLGTTPAETEPEPSNVAEETLKALAKKWSVKLGDVWLIGPHRIICGDSTKSETYRWLMQPDELCQLYYSDPPYGASYDSSARGGGRRQMGKVKNDTLTKDGLSKFLTPALDAAFRYLRPDGAGYIWHASSTRRDFEHALDSVGFREKQYITWVKEHFALGQCDYHWQTEPCFYVEKSNGAAKWFGDRAQTTVWRIQEAHGSSIHVAITNGLQITNGDGKELFIKSRAPKGKFRHVRVGAGKSVVIAESAETNAWEIARDKAEEYLHPTQKPVALAERAILNSSREGDLVMDNFHGAGGLMLACEKHKRICRAVELDPRYVAVALERMAEIGCQPERANTQRSKNRCTTKMAARPKPATWSSVRTSTAEL